MSTTWTADGYPGWSADGYPGWSASGLGVGAIGPWGLMLTDGLDGSVNMAWQTAHAPQYNIYINGVFLRSVTGLQTTVTALELISYAKTAVAPNPGNSLRPQSMPPVGVVTPAKVYNFKVVAAGSSTVEYAEIDQSITVGPTSLMLVTPMKRLWPFPNSTLD